jgi:iron complex outermembrane receptor protein
MARITKAQLSVLPLGAMLLASGMGFAQAQDSSTRAAEARESDDIIVTARRREESLQDVPIAITVATQEEITLRNIQSITDLQAITPGLILSGPYRNTPLVSIRGQGGYTPGGIPSVILYMNEVPFATSAQAGSPGGALGANGLFYDLENVQVAKGPQGTLFGRNTTGGAILVQSRRPGYDFGGHVTLTAGNYDNREFDAAINLPIVSDKLALRIASHGQKRDGFTKTSGTPNHPEGLDLDDTRNFSIRGSLLANFGNIENLTVVDYLKVNHNGVSNILKGVNPNPQHPVNRFFPELAALVAQQDALGIRKQGPLSAKMDGFLRRWSITNTTSVELNDAVTIKNIIAYSKSRYAQTIDGDGTIFPFFDPIQSQAVPYVTRQFSEEIQLQGSESLGGRLNWAVGVFYLKQPEEDNFTSHTNVTFGAPKEVGFKQAESSKAIYAQGDFSITEKLSLTLGARYTWDKISRASREIRPNGTCVSATAGPGCVLANSGKFKAPTWTVGLNYKLNPDTLLYVASRRGFRSGGFNLDGATPVADRTFGKEIVTDLELGAKTAFDLGGAVVSANLAVYRQWYDDIQLQQTVATPTGPLTLNKNAGEAEIDGIEFETTARFGDLTLRGHLNYIDFDYTKFDPGVVLPILPTVPKFSYGVGANYVLPLPESRGELSVSINYDWQKKSRITSYLDPFSDRPSYGLLTLGANWRNAGGSPFDLGFFMTNATDEEYPMGGLPILNALGTSGLTYGPPRMYGVRLGMRFGGEAD